MSIAKIFKQNKKNVKGYKARGRKFMFVNIVINFNTMMQNFMCLKSNENINRVFIKKNDCHLNFIPSTMDLKKTRSLM